MKNNSKISRRQFLQIVAISSAAGLALKFGFDTLTVDEMVSETRLLMGTIINIKAIGPDPGTTSAAINACFDHMAELESVMSRFQPESQLSRLNQVGVLKDAHPALVSLIQQSQKLSQLTDGAFDITVKPLLDLYQASNTLPTDEQVQATLSLVDYRKLNIDAQSVSFSQPGMSITLDGIAKGFIVDEGVAVLKQFAFENVLVEAGGDLMGLGEKAPQLPWKIGLQNPRAKMGSLTTTFTIENQAVATSGDYMQTFTPDFVNNHIIDPRVGHSSRELASTTIFAPSATLADGIATAVMVMGNTGLQLIENIPGCQAFLITKDSKVLKTSDFQQS